MKQRWTLTTDTEGRKLSSLQTTTATEEVPDTDCDNALKEIFSGVKQLRHTYMGHNTDKKESSTVDHEVE